MGFDVIVPARGKTFGHSVRYGVRAAGTGNHFLLAFSIGHGVLEAAGIERGNTVAVAYDTEQRRVRITRTDGPGFAVCAPRSGYTGQVQMRALPSRPLPRVCESCLLEDLEVGDGMIEGTIPDVGECSTAAD